MPNTCIHHIAIIVYLIGGGREILDKIEILEERKNGATSTKKIVQLLFIKRKTPLCRWVQAHFYPAHLILTFTDISQEEGVGSWMPRWVQVDYCPIPVYATDLF